MYARRMSNYYVPYKPSVKRLSQNSHTWTILTFAKVLKGPFNDEHITQMNPEKYPKGCRNIRDTLRHLKSLGLVESTKDGWYQITQEGVNTVYWFGGHFARQAQIKSNLSD
jgi:hypothetical protein